MRFIPSACLSLFLIGSVQAQNPSEASNSVPASDSARQATMIVLDGSNSMWAQVEGINKIVTARESLEQVLNSATDDIEFGLLAYGNRLKRRGCTDITLVSKPEDYDRDTMIEQVNDITPFGRSPIASALEEAAANLPKPNSRILLVSDGDESCDRDPCAVAAQLVAENPSLQIDVIGFQQSKEAQLECIAENGRGAFVFAEDTQRLETLLASASAPAVQTMQPTPNAPPSDAISATASSQAQTPDEIPPGSVELSLKATSLPAGELRANYSIYGTDNLNVASFTARKHVKEYLKPGEYRIKAVWQNYTHSEKVFIQSGINKPYTFDVGEVGTLKLKASDAQGQTIRASYAIYTDKGDFISRYVMLEEAQEQLPVGTFRVKASIDELMQEARLTVTENAETLHNFQFEDLETN